jgi:hypothetical protein
MDQVLELAACGGNGGIGLRFPEETVPEYHSLRPMDEARGRRVCPPVKVWWASFFLLPDCRDGKPRARLGRGGDTMDRSGNGHG